MRTLVTFLIGLAALGGGAYFLSSWANETCSPLDRLVGRSGCVSTIRIDNLAPLNRDTMSAQAADGTASLLGWERDAAGTGSAPVLVRVDLNQGREIARYRLDMGQGFDHAVFSADGNNVLLTCTSERDCAANGAAAAIVSAADGSQLSLVETWQPYPRIVPGEPAPGAGFTPSARFSAGGQTIIDENDNQDIVLLDAGGSLIATLMARAERWNVFPPHLVISPGQSRVALALRRYGTEGRDGFAIWDATSGGALFMLAASPGYRTASNPAWSADETIVYSIRPDGGDTLIDAFRIGDELR